MIYENEIVWKQHNSRGNQSKSVDVEGILFLQLIHLILRVAVHPSKYSLWMFVCPGGKYDFREVCLSLKHKSQEKFLSFPLSWYWPRTCSVSVLCQPILNCLWGFISVSDSQFVSAIPSTKLFIFLIWFFQFGYIIRSLSNSVLDLFISILECYAFISSFQWAMFPSYISWCSDPARPMLMFTGPKFTVNTNNTVHNS